jgi:hypothetical protein
MAFLSHFIQCQYRFHTPYLSKDHEAKYASLGLSYQSLGIAGWRVRHKSGPRHMHFRMSTCVQLSQTTQIGHDFGSSWTMFNVETF